MLLFERSAFLVFPSRINVSTYPRINAHFGAFPLSGRIRAIGHARDISSKIIVR
jgi:hypothetical protein